MESFALIFGLFCCSLNLVVIFLVLVVAVVD